MNTTKVNVVRWLKHEGESYVLPSEEKIVQGVKSVLAMQAAAV
jgi:hypothetical protein